MEAMPPRRHTMPTAALRRLLALLLVAVLALAAVPQAEAAAYDARPRLIIILVIDQFRADYLQRFRSEFRGRGFRLFLDHGAYFPDCYYGYANTKTAPGHATLGTGAYSDGHGISANEWWDLARNKQRPVSSVEDERYTLVSTGPSAAQQSGQGVEPGTAAAPSGSAAGASAGSPAPAGKALPGASPRNLLASTLGDELRLATAGQSRVYGVSLKDRAAILPAGAGANGAFWIDPISGRFLTSSYYMTALPQWAVDFNNGPAIAQAEAAAAAVPPTATISGASPAAAATVTNFYKEVGITDAANSYELAFSEALVAGENLGTHPSTDLLTISLSPNDIEGHRYGPDSPEEHAMVLGLDADLDSFAAWLDTHIPGGLANVWIALSADHGIAPTPAVSSAMGLPGAYLNTDKLLLDLNRAMNAKFSPGENVEYLLPHQELPYLSLNRPNFERAGINEQEAEDAVKAAMEPAFTSLAQPPGTMTQPAAALPAPTAATPLPTPNAASAAGPARTAVHSRTAAKRARPAGSTEVAAPAAVVETTQPLTPPPPRPAPNPQLFRSFTRQQLAAGDLPPTEFGQLLAHSYSPVGGWYVAAFPVAFQMEGSGSGTNHYSPWSYDRHVPLGFYGAAFAPGTYRGRVEPVDLAATLSSLLGINQPSASVGKVLTEALRSAAELPYPKEAAPVKRSRRRGAQPASPLPDATQPLPAPAGAPQ